MGQQAASQQRSGVSRRQFLVRTGVGGAWLAAAGGLGSVLAACGQSPSTGAAVQRASTKAVFGPFGVDTTIYHDVVPSLPRGGQVVIGSTAVGDTLDLLSSNLGATAWAAMPAHDFLEFYDQTGTLVPSLAERVDLVDGKDLRYTLHQGARFHNGRPVTARDVKACFDWVKDTKNGSAHQGRLEGVAVTVVDERTVLLQPEEPNAGLRANMPRIPIIPLETQRQQASRPVGCGPFKFQRFTRGSSIEYVKNPDYWNRDVPALDRLKVSFYPDAQAGAQAFLAKQMDFIASVPAPQSPAFQARGGAEGFKTLVIEDGWTYLGFNQKDRPFGDPRVRRAIALAVDRATIARAATGGLGQPLWFGAILPDHPWYPKDLEYGRDLEQARSLLQQAGATGLSATMLVIDQPIQRAAATVIQSNLAEIGVRIKPQVLDTTTFFDRILTKNDYQVFLSGYSIEPEPSAVFDVVFSEKNRFNYTNPKSRQLQDQARNTYDEQKRKDLYHQVFELLFVTDTVVAPVCTEASLYAYRDQTNGEQYAPTPISFFHYPIASTRSS
jgi:peptide/nickel transport system substrate-binding protein